MRKAISLNTWAAFEEYKKGNEGTYYRYSCPARIPLQAPQNMQGLAARPGKVVGSAMRYNNCGAAVTAETEQRRVVRNPPVSSQYAASSCSYPRRNPNYKSERVEDDVIEGSNGLQPKPQYIARKVAAAQGGAGGQWY